MTAGEIRIGTSGWHYPSGQGTWNGPFYPKPRPRGFDELAFYANRFNTVEVNATFYRQPEPAMSQAWLERTPAAFIFAIKLFQKFTHPDMYLKRPSTALRPGPDATGWDVHAGDVDLFRAGLDPIASAHRLGALLIQFPSSFHSTSDTRDYVSWLVRAFIDYPCAVEFRHQSWSDRAAETVALLDQERAALVRIDEPFAHLAPVQLRTAAPLAYFRLHGRNQAQWWEHAQAEDRYNYLYTEAELQPFADEAKAEAALAKRVLVYFNNHFSAKAVANADILKDTVSGGEIGETSGYHLS